MRRLRILCRFLACFPGLCILVVAHVSAAESPAPKRVLMLFSEGKDLPVNVITEQAATTELQSHSTNRIEFYAEHLDASRFPGESYYKLFREYLREKCARQRPDVVMPDGHALFVNRAELQQPGGPSVPWQQDAKQNWWRDGAVALVP